MSEEIWSPIPEWEGFYEASSEGRVRSLDRTLMMKSPVGIVAPRRFKGRVLAPNLMRHGYSFVTLTRPGKSQQICMHAAVCAAFYGPRPAGQEVRHLDGNRSNNRLANLCYGTRAENSADTVRHGRAGKAKGEAAGTAKLTAPQVIEIRLLEGRLSQRALARQFGVSKTQIRAIHCGIWWKHI